MEWLVNGRVFKPSTDQQILQVTADKKLKFIIWVKSNHEIPLKCTLTPVIDGYIANRNKGHFVHIEKVMRYSDEEWKSLQRALVLIPAEDKQSK